ncbi:MAG TPA: murein biosynthesis integral membrane protein MurJ [Actinomycetota bacterium]|nr:murein biosynthesis integral membrane protein MurJ [Actinomycetota bacterium]
MQERKLYRATVLMTAGTALSRLTGLARVAALTYALGVTGSRLADTYNIANTLPNIIFELFLGGVLTSLLVPVVISMRSEGRSDVSGLVTSSLIVLTALSVLTIVAAPLLIRVYTLRIDAAVRDETRELATFLLRWFAPQILFYGLSAIGEALLNVRHRFGPPKFIPVLNNLIWGGTFLAYARLFGEQGLSLSPGAKTLLGAGTTLGVVVQGLAYLPLLRQDRLRFRPDFSDPAIRSMLRLSGYVMAYVVVNQIGLWVVIQLAQSVAGGVTAYQVAFIFLQLPHGLFAVSLNSALHPDLSAAAVGGDWDSYRRSFAAGVRGTAFLLVPAAVGYALLSRPLARMLLARGASGVRDADAVASVLTAFCVGLPFFSLFQFLTRCFYALRITRTPTLVRAAAVAVHAAVNVPLFTALGVPGLALGHGISYAFGSIVLWGLLSGRVQGGLSAQALVSPVARVAASAAAMGAGVWAIVAWLGQGPFAVLAATAAGAVLYLVFSQVTGLTEGRMLLESIRRTPAPAPTPE